MVLAMKGLLALLSVFLLATAPLAQPDPLVGTWDWVEGQELRVQADGSLTVWLNGSQINSGTWTLTNAVTRTYVLRHRTGGWVDTVSLSADLTRLSGHNNHGSAVSGRRIGPPPTPPTPPVPTADVPRSIGPLHWCLKCGRNPASRVDYGVSIPDGVRTLLVRVRNGADDGGDEAVELWVDGPRNARLLYARPDEIGWQDYRIEVQETGDYWITLQDLDTPPDSQYPGNGGSIQFRLE